MCLLLRRLRRFCLSVRILVAVVEWIVEAGLLLPPDRYSFLLFVAFTGAVGVGYASVMFPAVVASLFGSVTVGFVAT